MLCRVAASGIPPPAPSPSPQMLPPLSPDQLVKPRYFELRIAAIFAALFVPIAIHLPYFPLWLEVNGFDAQQIAVILSVPMFLRVVTTPFITAWADTASDRANVLILLVVASLIFSLGYFLEPTYLIVMVVSVLLAIAVTPHSPLTDSLALSGVRRFGANYTSMRIWGSIAFLLSNLFGGIILSWTGAQFVPTLITASLCLTLVAALFAPRLGRPRRPSPLSAAGIHDAGPKLLTPYFVMFVAGAGVINASHAFLFGFVSLYWKSIGLSDTLIGVLWAWAVVAEAIMFVLFNRFFAHRAPTRVLALAGVAAMIRWTMYPLIEPLGLGLPGFFVAQALHSFSTALLLIGVQKLIADTVSEARTGTAQGIAFFANGFAMAAITLISGPLYAWFGVDGFYSMVVVAALGLALVLLANTVAPRH
jgi:PPP family 3-phenylpropionic acid transporter